MTTDTDQTTEIEIFAPAFVERCLTAAQSATANGPATAAVVAETAGLTDVSAAVVGYMRAILVKAGYGVVLGAGGGFTSPGYVKPNAAPPEADVTIVRDRLEAEFAKDPKSPVKTIVLLSALGGTLENQAATRKRLDAVMKHLSAYEMAGKKGFIRAAVAT